MRILVFFLLSGTLALSPEQCDQRVGDEVEYSCAVGNSTIHLAARQNEYVRVFCEGPINCTDIPQFDFASNLSLKSLSVISCSPRILRCINHVVSASSLDIVVLDKLTDTLVKEDVETLGQVRVLIMQGAGAQSALPIDAITSLPTIKDLRIGGGYFQLTPDSFKWGADSQLKYLELSKDNIDHLPGGVFNGLGKLNELNIWGNNIQNISPGAFMGLNSLQRLALNTNKLKFIDAGAFSGMPQLGSLVMTGNELDILPNGLFQGLEHLQNITIQMNRSPLSLDSQTFAQLPSIKNILIKYSGIQSLTNDIFNGTTTLLTLDLTYNKIEIVEARTFMSLISLKRLDLSHNKIKVLPKGIFAGLNMMEYINLDKNFIQVLPDLLFSGPTIIKEIYMNHNNISTIAWTAFQGASNLEILSLSNNKISLEQNSFLYQVEMYTPSPFQASTKLRKLNLSGNEIRNIFYDWRVLMTKLEVLDLSWNQFVDFEISEFDIFLSQKITVDLRNNNISHVILDAPKSPVNVTKPPSTTILLDNNPITCDCFTYGLRLRVDGIRYSMNEPKFDLGDAKCSYPPNLQDMLLRNIPPNNFVCQLPKEKPKECTSCIASVATNEIILTCPKMPSVLPDTKSESVTYYFINEPTITLNLKYQPEKLTNNIHSLNLSNSGINELDFKPLPSLKVLDISNNNLKKLPMEFLKYNITIYLSKNPLECECFMAENIAAIQNYRNIPDFAQLKCSNGDRIALLDVSVLCNTWKATMAALGTFITLAILVLVALLLTYKYYNEILVYLTSRGLCKCCISEVMLDKDKEFDVFVSFSHQDYELVQDKLLPKLEGDFHQKVCVHYRDWVVGDMIPAQIVRSVENSRRTVIILTKSFLESVWANLEFCAAHNLALQEGKARVILIVLDESITKHEKLSDELKAYISTNTYLLWSDPKFWEKLHKVLPRVQHKFTWLEYLKHTGNTEKVGSMGLDVQLNNKGQLVNIGKDKLVGKHLPNDFV